MIRHQYTDDNIAEGWPADFMCGCPKGDLLGPCEHSQEYIDMQADALDRWADGYVEPEIQTGGDEIEYAEESDYLR